MYRGNCPRRMTRDSSMTLFLAPHLSPRTVVSAHYFLYTLTGDITNRTRLVYFSTPRINTTVLFIVSNAVLYFSRLFLNLDHYYFYFYIIEPKLIVVRTHFPRDSIHLYTHNFEKLVFEKWYLPSLFV